MLPTGTPSKPHPAASGQELLAAQKSSDIGSSFRELFEFAPVSYHEIDAAGVLRRVNHTECRMLGYTSEEMIGRPVWQFVAADQQEQCREAIRRKVAGEEHLAPFER